MLELGGVPFFWPNIGHSTHWLGIELISWPNETPFRLLEKNSLNLARTIPELTTSIARSLIIRNRVLEIPY